MNSLLLFLGITHWETLLIVLLFLFFSFCLIAIYIKRKDKIIFFAISFGVIIGIVWFFITSNFAVDSNSSYVQETNAWLIIPTELFLSLSIFIVPLFIFVTIIVTLNRTRHKHIDYHLFSKSFFLIWLMPFIAITVALLFALTPIYSFIIIQETPTNIGNNNPTVTTLPEIINSFFPSSIAIFASLNFIISVVVISIFFGVLIHFIHRSNDVQGEKIISFFEHLNLVIKKYFFFIAFLIPFVIFSRIPILFNAVTIKNDFSGLAFFIIFFFIGLITVTFIEILLIIAFCRNRKKLVPTINNQFYNSIIKHSAPILLNDTIKNAKQLGVSDNIAETTPIIATSMGMSMCGGFYPAMIAIVTVSQTGVSLEMSIVSFVLLMYIIIMITNLGMTGVPGADIAVIISVLGSLGLPISYFATVYIIDGLLDKFRGIGNAFGFLAATVMVDFFTKQPIIPPTILSEKEEYSTATIKANKPNIKPSSQKSKYLDNYERNS